MYRTLPHLSAGFRLVNGGVAHEGRVEVYHDGEWGTVCSDSFGNREAEIICGNLGY